MRAAAAPPASSVLESSAQARPHARFWLAYRGARACAPLPPIVCAVRFPLTSAQRHVWPPCRAPGPNGRGPFCVLVPGVPACSWVAFSSIQRFFSSVSLRVPFGEPDPCRCANTCAHQSPHKHSDLGLRLNVGQCPSLRIRPSGAASIEGNQSRRKAGLGVTWESRCSCAGSVADTLLLGQLAQHPDDVAFGSIAGLASNPARHLGATAIEEHDGGQRVLLSRQPEAEP